MDSRIKNSTRNIIAGILNRFILILLPFASRTTIIYILGSEYLGLSSLFTSILMVLNLSELGIGSALVYSMYKPIADNNKTSICALLALYKKIYRIIGILLFSVGVLLLPFIPQLIKGDLPTGINIYILYFIYLFNTSISYFAFAHKKALFTAYQRSDILSNINTILTILLYTIQIIILILTRNYYLYVLIYPIFTLIENLWVGIQSKKIYPDLYCKGDVDKEEKSKIKQHTKGIALQQVCSTSRNSLDSIVISMFLGLTTIAMYSNYFYIMSSIHIFLYQIPNAIRASVGNSVACESVEKNYSNFNAMYLIYMWISGWCTVCLICLYQPFMYIWMGSSMMFPMSTVILFCLYFTLLNMSDIIALYKDAAGLWWYGRYRVIIEAVANLILNFLLGYWWGINGILIATIVTIIFLGHGYGGYIVFHYYFKSKSFVNFILNQLFYLIVITFVSLITFYTCNFITSTNNIWYSLSIKLVICIVIPNLLFGMIYINHQHFSISKLFLLNIINNLRNK